MKVKCLPVARPAPTLRLVLADVIRVVRPGIVCVRVGEADREISYAPPVTETSVVAALARQVRAVCVAGEDGAAWGLLGFLGVDVGGEERGMQTIEVPEGMVLRCGKASIALFADGKVVLRGTRVFSLAEDANIIGGGRVIIN